MGIMNVNAKYPGSTHDSYIWRRSAISTIMEQMNNEGMRSYYLLGRYSDDLFNLIKKIILL